MWRELERCVSTAGAAEDGFLTGMFSGPTAYHVLRQAL